MPHYALFVTEDDEIDYYPKLENNNLTVEQIEDHLTKKSIKKWSLYDHVPDEEDIEVFSGVCFDSSDEECDDCDA